MSRARSQTQTEPVDAVLAASRALVGIAAQSLGGLDDDVTLVQYRALLLIAEGRAVNPGELASAFGVHPSSATRLVDRLVTKGLISRDGVETDRREVALATTDAGRRVIRKVLTARRKELEHVLERLPRDEVAAVAEALGRFAEAAGETADDAWRLGWGS